MSGNVLDAKRESKSNRQKLPLSADCYSRENKQENKCNAQIKKIMR